MAIRAFAPVPPPEVETHHGIPILDIHVGDPIPTPRAPERYAVRITPDLARHWLTFNHPANRVRKERSIKMYRADMDAGFWEFTPQSIVFSVSGILEDGQNRLMAVTVHGQPVWMMVDVGWPDGIINRIDRGAARTVADAFKVDGIGHQTPIAAAIQMASRYWRTRGTTQVWTGSAALALTAAQAEVVYGRDPVMWQEAAVVAAQIVRGYNALSTSVWAAAFVIIATERDERDTAAAFFEELASGSGSPDSATRKLEKLYTRVKLSDARTGDRREPLENIIRAFNAWTGGRPFGAVKSVGFVLSRPRR